MPAYLIASAAITPETVTCNGPIDIDVSTLRASSDLQGHDYFTAPFPKFGRMDPLTRIALAVSELVVRASDNLLGIDRSSLCQVGASMRGCIAADQAFEASRAEGQPSPAKFVYTLPSMLQGEIAIRHKLQGRCTMLAAGRNSALQALVTGVRWIEKGRASAVLVVAADADDKDGHAICWLLADTGQGTILEDARTQNGTGDKALDVGGWPHGLGYVEQLLWPTESGQFYSPETGYSLTIERPT